jgi:pyridoxal phosphate enzyme (YggS family)
VAIGLFDIGESKVQEAEQKITELGHIARFHLVGHLQSNKVKKAVQLFDVIQSVDSLALAQEISRRAGELDRVIECYIEVNSSGETQKYGIAPERTLELVREVNALPNIKLSGLMTVGPLSEDEDAIRDAFKTVHELFHQAQKIAGDQFDVLSMGMSDDFRWAIAEGSTMIRIGTGIFGSRGKSDKLHSDSQ